MAVRRSRPCLVESGPGDFTRGRQVESSGGPVRAVGSTDRWAGPATVRRPFFSKKELTVAGGVRHSLVRFFSWEDLTLAGMIAFPVLTTSGNRRKNIQNITGCQHLANCRKKTYRTLQDHADMTSQPVKSAGVQESNFTHARVAGFYVDMRAEKTHPLNPFGLRISSSDSHPYPIHFANQYINLCSSQKVPGLTCRGGV